LYYLIYAISSILLFIHFEGSGVSFSLKELLFKLKRNIKQLTLGSLLVTLLFIFFPRFHNFLPKSNTVRSGQIGYSKTIDNTNAANIQLSAQTAFYAEINKELSSSQLYWRGRVNDQTDGYNWRTNNQSHAKKFKITKSNKSNLITKLKYEQDFDGDLILLNSPKSIIKANLNYYHQKGTNTYSSYSKKKKAIITASSISEESIKQQYSKKQLKSLTELPGFIPKDVQDISNSFESTQPIKIISLFKRYLIRNKFTYTLTPGSMPTLKDFINNKKGYCSHFASLLGVILRHKNIPTRLVSGFQGGLYNELGSYYTIKSNDAHVWVEYYDNGHWNSVDPTSFVSPSRIILGGEQFFNRSDILSPLERKQNFLSNNLYYAKQYLDNLNYKVSLFFDNFDKSKQNEISKSLKLKFKQFFILGFVLILLVLVLTYLALREKQVKVTGPHEKLINKLDRKLRKFGICLNDCINIKEMDSLIGNSLLSDQSKKDLSEIIKVYTRSKYSRKTNLIELEKLIKRFKPTLRSNN
jgi:hypothetical protein